MKHRSFGRLSLAAALVFTLLLTGCGGGGDRDREAFLSLRTALLEQGELELTARLRADYGDRVYEYRLSYAGGAEGGLLTVEEPMELRGVRVQLEDGRARLGFGELQLDTGALVRELSPLQAFPLMIRAWLRGSVVSCWHERLEGEDCVAAEIDLSPAGENGRLSCRVWFRRGDPFPLLSELYADGRACLLCRFQTEKSG